MLNDFNLLFHNIYNNICIIHDVIIFYGDCITISIEYSVEN